MVDVPSVRSRLALRLINCARLKFDDCSNMMPRKSPTIAELRAGVLPLVVLFKKGSLRANKVRYGLVIELGPDLELLVIGFIRDRRLCCPPWVTGHFRVVVIKKNNLVSPSCH